MNGTAARPGAMPCTAPTSRNTRPRSTGTKAKASGISFAFIKATEGGDRVDDYFDEHWRSAKAAGVPRGAYHFYYFCRPAAEQARWFIRNVPRDRSALPPVLDMEWNPQSPTCKLRPDAGDGAQRDAASSSRSSRGTTARSRSSTPRSISSTTTTCRPSAAIPTGCARSPATRRDRYGGHPFTFWQYTGTGVVPGIKGNADINVFNGSQSRLEKVAEGEHTLID